MFWKRTNLEAIHYRRSRFVSETCSCFMAAKKSTPGQLIASRGNQLRADRSPLTLLPPLIVPPETGPDPLRSRTASLALLRSNSRLVNNNMSATMRIDSAWLQN